MCSCVCVSQGKSEQGKPAEASLSVSQRQKLPALLSIRIALLNIKNVIFNERLLEAREGMGNGAVRVLISAVGLPLLICLPLLRICLGIDGN